MVKKVAAIHDISCFGRCSMQVVWPVLSRFGLQVCPLPTALLSTHTGGFDGFSFLDLSDEMKKISDHWRNLGLSFDAVYTGFLGSESQIETVNRFIKDFAAENTLVLVDPVMGDNGVVYRTYTPAMCDGMRTLCECADIITPNLTEAFILLNEPYSGQPDSGKQKELVDRLLDLGKKPKRAVIVTGVYDNQSNTIGALVAVRDNGQTLYSSAFAPYCDCFFPGCGDLFASILLGKVINGYGISESVRTAVDFISKASALTYKNGSEPRNGVEFENILEEIL